ncbi:TRP-like family [Phaffia rhodozyma]|uniref:TRP-like family n=1 Tax=Phaffia rhodozyma TaxID=264483 RepID=A0A0F7SYQ8_PHARH|nr:TRP-like family [Phaffia rhodozyma]
MARSGSSSFRLNSSQPQPHFASSSSIFRFLHAFLVIVSIYLLNGVPRVVVAAPLELSLTSCVGHTSINSSPIQFTQGYFQFGKNSDGLLGPQRESGSELLRVDLIGSSSEVVSGFDNTTDKLATLFTSTTFLSSPVLTSASSLCYSLHPSPAPTTSTDDVETCIIPSGPVALNLSLPFNSIYPLTTLRTQVRIVDTAYPNPNELACVELEMTPYYPDGWYYRLVLWIPVGIAVGYWAVLWGGRAFASWCAASTSESERVGKSAAHQTGTGHGRDRRGSSSAAVSAGVKRKWSRVLGTAVMSAVSGDVLVTSPSLLRFVTPGFRDIIYHIQYCSFLSQIAVLWPDFVYPIATRGSWASLVGNVTFTQGTDAFSKLVDPFDLSSPYDPPSTFASTMNNSSSALYLDPSLPNVFLNMRGHSPGMDKYAFLVGIRPTDLFPMSAALFLLAIATIIVISLAVWVVHGVGAFLNSSMARKGGGMSVGVGSPPTSPGMFGRPLRELGDGEAGAYEHKGRGKSPVKIGGGRMDRAVASPARRQWWKFSVKGDVGAFYASSLQGNLIRVFLLFQGPLTAFTTYHFYLASTANSPSTTSIALAAVFFILILIAIPVYLSYRLATTPSPKLYDATRTLLALGPLYNVFGEGSQLYATVLMAASFIAGVVIGAGQKSGTTQVIILLVQEITVGLMTAVWLPWGLGASMGAMSFMFGVLRTITMILVLILCQAINIGNLASTWIAYAVVVIQAVVFLLYLLALIIKLIEALVRLIVRARFDDSADPYDSGILGAFSKASCCGDSLIRSSGRRRQNRRQGFRPRAGDNFSQHSQAPSQQGMLDLSRSSMSMTPARTPATNFDGTDDSSYFPRLVQDFSNETETGFIMGGWRPPPLIDYGGTTEPSSEYSPLRHQRQYSTAVPPDSPSPSTQLPQRGFSMVRGGRAAYETPYSLKQTSPPASPGPYQGLLYGQETLDTSTSHQQYYNESATASDSGTPSSMMFLPDSSGTHGLYSRPSDHYRKKSEPALSGNNQLSRTFNTSYQPGSNPSFSQSGFAIRPLPISSMPVPNEADDEEEDAESFQKPKRSSWFVKNPGNPKDEISDSDFDSELGSPPPGQAATSKWPFGSRKTKERAHLNREESIKMPSGPNAVGLSVAETSPSTTSEGQPVVRSFKVIRPKRQTFQSQTASTSLSRTPTDISLGKQASIGYGDILPVDAAGSPPIKSSFIVHRPERPI